MKTKGNPMAEQWETLSCSIVFLKTMQPLIDHRFTVTVRSLSIEAENMVLIS